MLKRIILLTLLIAVIPAYGENLPNIKDELTDYISLAKPLPTKIIFDKTDIQDELLNPEYNDSIFRLGISATGEKPKVHIDDELITDEFISTFSNKSIETEDYYYDDFIANTIDLNNVKVIEAKNNYDFTKKEIPVNIKIEKSLNIKDGISEGDEITFLTTNEIEINDKTFPTGTKIIGRVETISASDKMGTPESVRIDNFYIKDHPEININGWISKTGANRSIWVYPLYQAGNICLYVAGFVFVPIHGGHAKLSTKDNFTIYYETKNVTNIHNQL